MKSIFPDYEPRVCQRSAHLIEQRPEIFFLPAYVAHRGWIGARLDPGLDFDELADLLDDAYRLVAPRSLVQSLDQTEIQ
jgi:predicted DNA-binding protein (MmcQ/YjbR family)